MFRIHCISIFSLEQFQLPVLKDLITHLAIDTLAMLTVVLIQMEQGLCIGGILDYLPQHFPLAYDGVILCGDLLHDRGGVECLIAMLRVRVFIRNNGVDKQNIYTTLP